LIDPTLLLCNLLSATYCTPRDLHSCPTRRSSDLTTDPRKVAGSSERQGLRPLIDSWRDATLCSMLAYLEPYPACKVALRTRAHEDRKSTRLNSSHVKISYAVFCLKKKNTRANTTS